MITAISFDIWDTLVVDNSDEPRRAAQGLASKVVERRRLIEQAFAAQGSIDPARVSLASDVVDAAFSVVWREDRITWPLERRVAILCRAFQRDLAADVRARLAEELAAMEVTIPPDAVAGAAETLRALSARYRLGVVSDTVYTPGRNLRRLLAHHGLLEFFGACVFSDEAGRSKPDPRPFELVASQLGATPTNMVHIGDRQHNDIAGAQALGMKAVLFVGARDADLPGNTADAVCRQLTELPAIIQQWG